MSDLIDRQMAISALRYAQHRFVVADEAGGLGTVKWSEDVIYFAAAERALTELPSAQPDNSYSDGFADGYKRGLIDAQPERKSPCANCQEFDCYGCGAEMEVSE